MTVLYLTEQQAWVGREGGCLVVHLPSQTDRRKREQKVTIPLIKIKEVIIQGDITLTTPALTSLLAEQIQVIYLNQHGSYVGTLSPSLGKNSLLRLAQHEAYRQPEKKWTIAQRCVIGKLRNMRAILSRYHRNSPDQEISSAIEQIKASIRQINQLAPLSEEILVHEIDGQETLKIERMHGLGTLLGYEGAGSAAYFGVFPHLLKCSWEHGFTKRVRRPPTDPVNVLLSYGYTLLSSYVASAVASVGFDPYVGYLHASRYGKPALALDLMEEFRPLIVDSVVLTLFNTRQVSAEYFEQELNQTRMKKETKRLFLQKLEDRMQEEVTHPLFQYRASYRRCIELQARLLAKYLLGEVRSYRPFVVR